MNSEMYHPMVSEKVSMKDALFEAVLPNYHLHSWKSAIGNSHLECPKNCSKKNVGIDHVLQRSFRLLQFFARHAA